MTVAILIKTFMREACLFNTLDSIAAYCDLPYRLYIADDGPISPKKASRYEQLTRDGHRVLRLAQPTAVTAARNTLVRLLRDEQLVLRIDDDFEFFEETRLSAMRSVLDADPAVGAVADVEIQCGDGKGVKHGELSPNQGFLDIRDEVLFKTVIPVADWEWLWASGIRYAYADHTRNFLLMRRRCVESCPWDERIFIQREHVDFMLSIVCAGWKLAFTPDSIHRHRDDLAREFDDDQYRRFRRIDPFAYSGTDVLFEKWGVRKFKSTRTRPN